MNSRILALSTLTLAILTQPSLAQPPAVERTVLGTEAAQLYDSAPAAVVPPPVQPTSLIPRRLMA